MKNLAQSLFSALAILAGANLLSHSWPAQAQTMVDAVAEAAAAAEEGEKALTLKKEACTLEPIDNCNEAGKMAISGVGGVVDHKYAALAFDKGCAAQDYKACTNVAVLKQHGRGVDKDEISARQSYAKLCGNHEIQAACHNLAGMMLRGTGGEQSQLGLFIYRANCAADYPASCALLKRFLAEQSKISE